MRVALVYPPACDPTAPYLSVPALTGFLRAHGEWVLPVDANVEAFDALLAPAALGRLRRRLEARLSELDARDELSHPEQLEYAALVRARAEARAVPRGVARAKAVLRDEALFHDLDAYASAVSTIDAALRVVSATHHPLHVDFTAYRTPFGLTSMEELGRASRPAADPFDAYVTETLVPRLREAGVGAVGLSVCFPGQLQPAYAFALKIKRALPEVHLTCGGPAITQVLVRLSGERLARALGPFDSACLFEGEHALLDLLRALEAGRAAYECPNLVARDAKARARRGPDRPPASLAELPAPDFDGLPLAAYFAPHLVLPYDPTRGCYWGRCAFCHYGLAESGTAAYRERDVTRAAEHLRALSAKHGTRYFYLSQDSVAPKTIVKLAAAITEAGLDVRWATDLKPAKYLTRERAETLRRGGAVACALGVESASPRILSLIDKGASVEIVSDVIDHLAFAGIAAEAMCFTDFPTETGAEALRTLEFLRERWGKLAVFIVGEFGLTHGSRVARSPEAFGIREIWELEGDELGLGVFFSPERRWKTDAERARIDARLDELARGWALRPYPWAGAVSTAHTILTYDRRGASVFRDLAARGVRALVLGAGEPIEVELRFDPGAAARAEPREGAIWAELVGEQRRVGRAAYEALASRAPRLRPRRARVRVALAAGDRHRKGGRREG